MHYKNLSILWSITAKLLNNKRFKYILRAYESFECLNRTADNIYTLNWILCLAEWSNEILIIAVCIDWCNAHTKLVHKYRQRSANVVIYEKMNENYVCSELEATMMSLFLISLLSEVNRIFILLQYWSVCCIDACFRMNNKL